MRNQLENSRVKVSSGAPYHLILTREDSQRRSASYTGAGRSAEIELTNTLDYEIRGANNLLLLQNQQEVPASTPRTRATSVAPSRKAVQQTVELRQRLVRNLLQHLQMITPQQLEQLQQAAQAKQMPKPRPPPKLLPPPARPSWHSRNSRPCSCCRASKLGGRPSAARQRSVR